MKVIRNKIIPFKGFKAINLCGVLFVRENMVITDITLNHERIHTAQIKELWYIGFYLLYLLMWLKNLIIYRNFKRAYRNIKFEREAFAFESVSIYLYYREKFHWRRMKNESLL